MYMPTLARFTARDPMPVDGTALLGGPPNHAYAYVHNNPINSIDPSGLKEEGLKTAAKCWRDRKSCIETYARDTPEDLANAITLFCDPPWRRCIKGALPPDSVTPLPSSSPECDKYNPGDSYARADARCFCKCAGDSDWSKFVRACLRELYERGEDPHIAHQTCYELADMQNFEGGRPWTTLVCCYAKCVF